MKTATARPEALEATLGPDLAALIDAVGVPVVETVQVTTIPAHDGGRASFRVTLADGQVLKARRVRTPADAGRIARLSALLDPEFFPRILGHRGCGLLTWWVPGVSVRGADWTSRHLRTCGRLQATIHRLPVSAEPACLRRSPIRWEDSLDELVRRGALEIRRARAVRDLADATAPTIRGTAVCHRDFCGDNIILSDAGQVCVIDNEGIAVDSPEYDLARTWYRWPMTASQHRAYAEGYGRHEHVARFVAHFLHWALVVLVESAAYRTRLGAATARVPLERLTDLLRTRGQSDSFPRLLSRA